MKGNPIETCFMEKLERFDGMDPSYRCSKCGHENYEYELPAYCPKCGTKVGHDQSRTASTSLS